MSSSTENGTNPLNSKIITKRATRCWGSFQYRENGKNQVFKFTKAGNDGESGIGGYVFGRREDCDFV